MAAEQSSAETIDRPTIQILVVLTFTAGVFDAVSFLALDQVFVAIITGNLALLGFAIAGAPELSIDGPAVALVAFFVGAALISRIDHSGDSRMSLLLRTIGLETAMIALALAASIGYEAGDNPRRLLIIALLAGAMGGRNETVRLIGVKELRTTVQTLTLATLASDVVARRAHGPATRRRLVGLVALVAGAITGGLLVVETEIAWALALLLAIYLGALARLRVVAGSGRRARPINRLGP